MSLLGPEPQAYPDHLFQLSVTAAPWWVLYVRARQEKKLARRLVEEQVPFYLPQQEKRALISGKQRVSYLPLFPGYVFLRGDRAERLAAVRSNLIVHTLEVLDQERLHGELGNLWALQQAGLPLVPIPYLEPGDEVEIREGPFAGYRGQIVRLKGTDRLVVSITFLRRSVAAEMDRGAVRLQAPSRPRELHRVPA